MTDPMTTATRRRLVDSPLFWLASSAVFSVNAVLSAGGGHWLLATFQSVTGALAGSAAVVESGRRRQPEG